MKLFRFAFCLAATVTSLLCSAAELAKVGDFALLDHQGKSHQLSWYGDQSAIVIFIQGNGCPNVRNAVPTLKQLRNEFQSQGVAFFMLNPQMGDDRESIAKEAEEFGYDLPILVDEAQLVAESLDVDRASESFVIDPKTMTVVFRGPIDDRMGDASQKRVAKHHYLKDALNAVLSGQTVADATFAACFNEYLGTPLNLLLSELSIALNSILAEVENVTPAAWGNDSRQLLEQFLTARGFNKGLPITEGVWIIEVEYFQVATDLAGNYRKAHVALKPLMDLGGGRFA